MREERVVLEHHRRAAPDRREADDIFTVDPHLTGGRHFVPGDHAQYRRLAAAARAQEATVGARGDPQADAVDRHRLAKALGAVDEFDFARPAHWRL
jgi:hypothetical protein